MDVLVVGGGNAVLCAAPMAREAGALGLLLETAPRSWRGGNAAQQPIDRGFIALLFLTTTTGLLLMLAGDWKAPPKQVSRLPTI